MAQAAQTFHLYATKGDGLEYGQPLSATSDIEAIAGDLGRAGMDVEVVPDAEVPGLLHVTAGSTASMAEFQRAVSDIVEPYSAVALTPSTNLLLKSLFGQAVAAARATPQALAAEACAATNNIRALLREFPDQPRTKVYDMTLPSRASALFAAGRPPPPETVEDMVNFLWAFVKDRQAEAVPVAEGQESLFSLLDADEIRDISDVDAERVAAGRAFLFRNRVQPVNVRAPGEITLVNALDPSDVVRLRNEEMAGLSLVASERCVTWSDAILRQQGVRIPGLPIASIEGKTPFGVPLDQLVNEFERRLENQAEDMQSILLLYGGGKYRFTRLPAAYADAGREALEQAAADAAEDYRYFQGQDAGAGQPKGDLLGPAATVEAPSVPPSLAVNDLYALTTEGAGAGAGAGSGTGSGAGADAFLYVNAAGDNATPLTGADFVALGLAARITALLHAEAVVVDPDVPGLLRLYYGGKGGGGPGVVPHSPQHIVLEEGSRAYNAVYLTKHAGAVLRRVFAQAVVIARAETADMDVRLRAREVVQSLRILLRVFPTDRREILARALPRRVFAYVIGARTPDTAAELRERFERYFVLRTRAAAEVVAGQLSLFKKALQEGELMALSDAAASCILDGRSILFSNLFEPVKVPSPLQLDEARIVLHNQDFPDDIIELPCQSWSGSDVILTQGMDSWSDAIKDAFGRSVLPRAGLPIVSIDGQPATLSTDEHAANAGLLSLYGAFKPTENVVRLYRGVDTYTFTRSASVRVLA